MAYRITLFDDVALPFYNWSQDLGPGDTPSGLRASLGGAYDFIGTRQRLPVTAQHAIEGVYAGDDLYWADHLDNQMVDESDNALMIGDMETTLRAQIDLIANKLGARGTLWRQRADDSALQWKTARLIAVTRDGKYDERTTLATVACTFETAHAAWRAQTQKSDAANLAAYGYAGVQVNNGGGVTVEDAQILIAATSTITAIRVEVPRLGVYLTWAGTLASGSTLTIDCGAKTVRNGTTDAYSGFALGAAHTALTWLSLPVGPSSVLVYANGTGTATIKHYDQFE